MIAPHGCRWCGIEKREHVQLWTPERGWHGWEAPTPDQLQKRIKLLRYARRDARDLPPSA